MAYRLFVYCIPVEGGESMEELNGFLGTHRIIAVDKSIQNCSGKNCWTFLVEYAAGGEGVAASSGNGAGHHGRDYRDSLSEEDFSVYCLLRDERKKIAAEEGLQFYVIFTNEQLAAMVTERVTTLEAMGKIRNVGEARLKKYGGRMLAILQNRFAKEKIPENTLSGEPSVSSSSESDN